MTARDHLRPIAMTVGAAACATGTFLPWLRSGERARHSYELFQLVERLGFASDGAMFYVFKLWPAVPALLAASVAAYWVAGVPLTVRTATPMAAALFPMAVAVGILTAPDIELFTIGAGPVVVLLGGAVMVAVAIVDVSATRRARRARP